MTLLPQNINHKARALLVDVMGVMIMRSGYSRQDLSIGALRKQFERFAKRPNGHAELFSTLAAVAGASYPTITEVAAMADQDARSVFHAALERLRPPPINGSEFFRIAGTLDHYNVRHTASVDDNGPHKVIVRAAVFRDLLPHMGVRLAKRLGSFISEAAEADQTLCFETFRNGFAGICIEPSADCRLTKQAAV